MRYKVSVLAALLLMNVAAHGIVLDKIFASPPNMTLQDYYQKWLQPSLAKNFDKIKLAFDNEVSGEVGATGIQGPIGLTGTQGATGIQGPIGLTGTQGATGIQGVQGLTGTQGATGATGPSSITTAWTSWSPTFTVSGGTAPTFLTHNSHHYTVVGKICYVEGNCCHLGAGGTPGSGTGSLQMSLPVAPSSNIDTTQLMQTVGDFYRANATSSDTGIIMFYQTTGTVYFRRGSAGSVVDVTGNDLNSTTRYLSYSFHYEVD